MKSSSSSLLSALLYLSLSCLGKMNWCACFGLPLWHCCDCGCAFFVKHILVKCPILLQCLHWYFFAWQLNACVCGESPHLVHWFGFLLYDCCWYGYLCCSGHCGLVSLIGCHASVVVSQYVDLSTTLHVCCMLFYLFGSGFD